jgi:UDP-N-acetylenolpyruvoylglucosamine reductase
MNDANAILENLTPDQIADELTGRVSAATVIRRHEPMARHTTLRVGGAADVYVEPALEEDLAAVLKFCGTHQLKFFILGRGSNLLVRDGGFRGLVICLSQPAFSRIELVDGCLHCGAGARLKNVSIEARRNALSGLEFLEGIPGSIGGALRMNAGAMAGATFDVVKLVRVMDYAGEVREMAPADMTVEYRCCATLKDHIALSAVLAGRPDSVESIAQRMLAFGRKRWTTQPAAPSAGCMFKNPDTIPAGKLVDELGLKGTKIGGAMVSMEHGNFIVNDGHATSKDVIELISLVRERARAERGIDLHTEVEIIGEP